MIKSNNMITHIDGYLDALSDIDGKQREFITRAFFSQSKKLKIEKEIGNFFDYMQGIEIIKKETYSSDYGVNFILEKLLLSKPYSGLYEPNTNFIIPYKIQSTYKNYIIFHIVDYIDFLFEANNISFSEKKEMCFLLMKNEDTEFYTLIIKKNNIKLFFVFFREYYTSKEFISLYNEIIDFHILNTKEYNNRENKRKYIDKNKICENGVSIKVNQEVIAPIISEAIEIGYFNNKMKQILLQYFSKEDIVKFEEDLF